MKPSAFAVLLGGLTLLAFAQALKFPVFIVFGLILIPVALGLIGVAGYLAGARKPAGASSNAGLFILLGGLGLLGFATWNVAMLARQFTLAAHGLPLHPDYALTPVFLGRVLMESLGAAAALGLALYSRTGRWEGICTTFTAATLFTYPATALLFFLLNFLGFPLNA